MAKKMTKIGLSLACVAALGAAQLAPVTVPVFGSVTVKAVEGNTKMIIAHYGIEDDAGTFIPLEQGIPYRLNPGESVDVPVLDIEGYHFIGYSAVDSPNNIGHLFEEDNSVFYEELTGLGGFVLHIYEVDQTLPSPPSTDEQPGQPTPPAPPSTDEQPGQPTSPVPPSTDEQPGQPTPPVPPSTDEQPGQATPPNRPSTDEQPGQPTPPAPPSTDEQPGQPTPPAPPSTGDQSGGLKAPTPAPKADGAETGKEAAQSNTSSISAQAVQAPQQSEKATSPSSKTLPNTGDVTAAPIALTGLGFFLASLGLRPLKKRVRLS